MEMCFSAAKDFYFSHRAELDSQEGFEVNNNMR